MGNVNKIVIVGANHSGLAAQKFLSMAKEKKFDIIMIDKSSKISYLSCGLSLLIKKEINNLQELYYATPQELCAEGVQMLLETEVIGIDVEKKQLFCKRKVGSKFRQEYGILILATGSKQLTFDIPNSHLDNIFTVKKHTHALELMKTIVDDSIDKVGIIGAGYIGVELAEAISKIDKEVYLIDAADRVLSMYYDEDFSNKVEALLIENNVHLCLGQTPKSYIGKNKIKKIVTNLENYSIDMVIQAIGFIPNSQIGGNKFMKDLTGAYLTNKYQQTSVKDVYAIGDCATTFSSILNQNTLDYSISNAVRSAYIASKCIMGETFHPFSSHLTNGFSIYDYKFYSIGMNFKMANLFGMIVDYVEMDEKITPYFMKDITQIKLRIIFEKSSKKIVGAQIFSQEECSGLLAMFSLAIEKQVTIDELQMLDYLFYPQFSQPYNFILRAMMSSSKK